jgi:hypothetical protein
MRLAEALKTLERNTHDLDANDFVARHYCFKDRDWKKGLRYLEKSRMSEAAALAKEEINANDANPVMPGTLVRLARKWWDYGGRTALNTPQSAAATRMHAKDIYIEHILKITDQSDVDWANQWLDGDKDFTQLVKNLRPSTPAVLRAGLLACCYKRDEGQPAGFLPANFAGIPAESTVHAQIAFQPLDGIGDFSIKDRFHVVWSGVIRVEKTGLYKFFLNSDDGSKLTIDGKLVIDNGGLHGMTEKAGEAMLASGDHTLNVELFEETDVAGCILSWEPPGGLKEVVPTRVLFHDSASGVTRKKLIQHKEIFLSEIPEGETKVVHFGFGKGTVNGKPIRSIIDGSPSPHGLAMHPGDGPDDQCFAKYKLPAGCKRFKAVVTLDQTGSFAHCGIEFEVIADGRSVWKSQTIDKGHQSESCDIPITGCRNLELRTYTVTAAFGGHAVWIEPRIAVDPHDTRTTDETPALAPDKAVAEWVLQRGGSVEIEMADRSRNRLATIDDLTGLSTNHEGPVVKVEQRLRWQNEKNIDSRLVYHANANIWREEDSKGNFVFSFVERSRTPEYVELFDDSRKVVLRAYPDRVMYSDAGGTAFELWRGRWVDGPGEAEQFSVVGIELTAKPDVTDQGLACVARLHRLEWLGVGGTAVTDALFDHLRSLPNLRGIGVNWTGVSGHGLATLADAQLKHLEISGMKDPEVAIAYLNKRGVAEWINFDGMKMTPESVRLLGEMKTLKALHFRHGLIAEEQLEVLKRQLPACHFHIWR